MKRLILLCAVVMGFAFTATTASAQDNEKAEFKFNEEKHDFGKIPQGKPVTTEFVFTNIGKEPLILSEVRPTCGCTIADYTKTPVKSGEKGVAAGSARGAPGQAGAQRLGARRPRFRIADRDARAGALLQLCR